MKVAIVEDIGEVLPKYVLRKDGTLLVEFSNQKRTGPQQAPFNLQEAFWEGAVEILSEKRRLKRNNKLRIKAIERYGLNCYVCGLNFEDQYGNFGAGYIELHHLNLLADSTSKRESTVHDVRVVIFPRFSGRD